MLSSVYPYFLRKATKNVKLSRLFVFLICAIFPLDSTGIQVTGSKDIFLNANWVVL
jgi:hypothetical protein